MDVSPYGTRNPSRGEPNPHADRYPVQQSWRAVSMERHLPFLQQLEADIRSRDSRIVKVIANLAFQVSDILIVLLVDDIDDIVDCDYAKNGTLAGNYRNCLQVVL